MSLTDCPRCLVTPTPNGRTCDLCNSLVELRRQTAEVSETECDWPISVDGLVAQAMYAIRVWREHADKSPHVCPRCGSGAPHPQLCTLCQLSAVGVDDRAREQQSWPLDDDTLAKTYRRSIELTREASGGWQEVDPRMLSAAERQYISQKGVGSMVGADAKPSPPEDASVGKKKSRWFWRSD